MPDYYSQPLHRQQRSPHHSAQTDALPSKPLCFLNHFQPIISTTKFNKIPLWRIEDQVLICRLPLRHFSRVHHNKATTKLPLRQRPVSKPINDSSQRALWVAPPHLGVVFHHPVGHCDEWSVRYRMWRIFWIFELVRAEVLESMN